MKTDKVKVVSSSVPRPSHCTALCHRSPSVHSRPNGQELEEERAGEAETGYRIKKASIPLSANLYLRPLVIGEPVLHRLC